MFYSQTYLGRKGPLATVWCAAHLQHRLKKSHYIATNLRQTIEYIMYPEVPIALRMSGHLLLGIVRIYSKQIDYLYQEYNIVLTGLKRVSVQVDLPEEARQAPPQAITLPGTFQLDAMDMDDPHYPEGDRDTHLKDREEITLIDQVPTGMDPYVAVSFDEDVLNSSEGLQPPPDSAVGSGDTETLVAVSPSREADTGAMNQGSQSQHPVPSTPHGETPGATERNSLVQDIPEIEIMRDAAQDFSMDTFPPLADHQKDLADLVMSQSPNDKRVPSPIVETVLASGGTSQLMQDSGQLNSAALDQAPEIHDAHVTFDHPTPEIAIRSSPPLQQPPLQQPRPRRRRQFFDETVVLTNSFMKKALEDPRDILRKRKSLPCSSLGLWKLGKRQRKEQALDEPVISGISMDLCNLYKKDYLLPNPRLVQHDEDLETMARATPCSVNEALSNGRAAESPVDVPSSDMEIERLRDDGSHVGGSVFPDFSHLPAKSMRSPSTRDDFTPLSSNFPSASDFPGETTTDTSVLPTPDAGASTGTYGSDMETPLTFLDECLLVENTRLSDIPETNVEDEDLFFLEADSSSPAGFSETQGDHSLSVRTRAVAQYLQRLSPSSNSQEPENLSLNTILEGKTRRLCARMFFQTLVLKSYGLVDVQQAEPYGDISLKLTPTFSKADI